jgi:hypothetical protein
VFAVVFRRFLETSTCRESELTARIGPPRDRPRRQTGTARDVGEILVDELRLLAPKSDAQAEGKAQILHMIVDLRQTQWLCF